ncbi:MAG TPA: glycosyltransferase family 2 protein, partial [Gemmataceae bacterium]|nr:glycosyltransferase family 2 protein [Gemmataceae bacterium]
MSTRVAVLVVAWNAVRQGHAADLLASLRNVTYPAWTLFVGDNGSVDDSAAVFAEFPGATVVRFGENLGFAEANNRLAELATRAGFDYAYLLNQDCVALPDFLEPAIALAEADISIGAVQSRILLHDDPARLNTIGNAIHFLGFGFSLGSGRPVAEFPRESWNGCDIAYASGAGMLVRLDVVRRLGLFERDFFLYHEDLDFGWQLRLVGLRSVMAYDSVVRHKWTFSRDPAKHYWLERNRWLVLFENYEAMTLFLLAPALALFEIGILGHAAKAGFLREKLRVYGEFLRWPVWRALLERRRRKQGRRTVRDRRIFDVMTGVIETPEIDGALLRIA